MLKVKFSLSRGTVRRYQNRAPKHGYLLDFCLVNLVRDENTSSPKLCVNQTVTYCTPGHFDNFVGFLVTSPYLLFAVGYHRWERSFTNTYINDNKANNLKIWTPHQNIVQCLDVLALDIVYRSLTCRSRLNYVRQDTYR